MLHTRYNEVGAKTQTAAAPADKAAAPAVKPKKP